MGRSGNAGYGAQAPELPNEQAIQSAPMLVVWPEMLLLFVPQVPQESKTRIVELT
jgi:hypothetical protein